MPSVMADAGSDRPTQEFVLARPDRVGFEGSGPSQKAAPCREIAEEMGVSPGRHPSGFCSRIHRTDGELILTKRGAWLVCRRCAESLSGSRGLRAVRFGSFGRVLARKTRSVPSILGCTAVCAMTQPRDNSTAVCSGPTQYGGSTIQVSAWYRGGVRFRSHDCVLLSGLWRGFLSTGPRP